MTKKIAKISVLIAIAGIIIWGVYYFLGSNPTTQSIIGNVFPGSEKGSSENASQSGLEIKSAPISSNSAIFDYWINKENGDIYLINEAGQILKESSGNNEELVNSQTLNKLNSIAPSYNGLFAIAKFNYPFSTIFSIFNTVTSAWSPLPSGTLAAAWSPNSSKIAYIDKTSLKILDLNSQKTQEILKLTQKDIELHWQTESRLLLSTASGSSVVIYAIDLNKKTITPFLEENGLKIHWADNGEFGVKLNYTISQQTASLIDSDGSTLTEFTFKTLPEKCFAGGTLRVLYCAIPKNIPLGLNTINDYYKKALYFDDAIYFIDLKTGAFSEVTANLDSAIDATHLEVFSEKLYFKNRIDNKLYSVQL